MLVRRVGLKDLWKLLRCFGAVGGEDADTHLFEMFGILGGWFLKLLGGLADTESNWIDGLITHIQEVTLLFHVKIEWAIRDQRVVMCKMEGELQSRSACGLLG